MLTRNGIYKFINSKRIPINNGILINFYKFTQSQSVSISGNYEIYVL